MRASVKEEKESEGELFPTYTGKRSDCLNFKLLRNYLKQKEVLNVTPPAFSKLLLDISREGEGSKSIYNTFQPTYIITISCLLKGFLGKYLT